MFQFKSNNSTAAVSYNGYTLILPSVSVGNVGQLCVDLYISSLNCKKVGYVWHPSIMPVVGCNPFDNSIQALMISSEMYQDMEHKLLFLQIRSPLSKRLIQDFLDGLIEWIQSNNILKVIVLAGSSYTAGKTELIEGEKLRYMFTPNLEKENANSLSTLQWTPIIKSATGDNQEIHVKKLLPGCGFANTLYEMCFRRSIRAAVLVKYCSEGDNIPDAYNLAEYLDQWVDVIQCSADGKKQWVNPFSWKLLFGKSIPKIIY